MDVEQVVEVVRDAPASRPIRLHLLRVPELLLESQAFALLEHEGDDIGDRRRELLLLDRPRAALPRCS